LDGHSVLKRRQQCSPASHRDRSSVLVVATAGRHHQLPIESMRRTDPVVHEYTVCIQRIGRIDDNYCSELSSVCTINCTGFIPDFQALYPTSTLVIVALKKSIADKCGPLPSTTAVTSPTSTNGAKSPAALRVQMPQDGWWQPPPSRGGVLVVKTESA
jgi:hypothetical protein